MVDGRELGQLSDAELRAVSEQAAAMLEGHATALDTVTHMLAAISGPDEAPHAVGLAMLLHLLSEHAQAAIEMGGAARLELKRHARN